jgi:hypothetical protein
MRTKLKAIRELGLRKTVLYGLYSLGKKTGYYARATTPADQQGAWLADPIQMFASPPRETLKTQLGGALPDLLTAADEILRGQVRIFGTTTIPLNLDPSPNLQHWIHHESAQHNGRDIKFTWEPGRFGWAFTLARAWYLSDEDAYAESFWKHFTAFSLANRPYRGPHWASAQEVGLRLIALYFAGSILPRTDEQTHALKLQIAHHATRIPPTLLYARAQNNNHLLTEAAALYTAGHALPTHPHAAKWRKLGWTWLHRGLQAQLAADGTYMQQSVTYHRVMLHAALWSHAIATQRGDTFPAKTRKKLVAATHWLHTLTDSHTGRTPNLGPNDGAYILPLDTAPIHDHRPTLQAASVAFCEQPALPIGPWDEMRIWLGGNPIPNSPLRAPHTAESIHRLDHPDLPTRAYMRTAHFTDRPGHADQLHIDLWWRGENITLDPGTYLYNADPPWQNALVSAFVHNTLTIDGRDQMTPAGKFLYVDRAQAQVTEATQNCITAEHDGYRALGLTHTRTLATTSYGWDVTDHIRSKDANDKQKHSVRLHWLFPDLPWTVDDHTLTLDHPRGAIRAALYADALPPEHASLRLLRAGEVVLGAGNASPVWGWFSPTYAQKIPALALEFSFIHALPLTLTTRFTFPD